MLTDRPDLPGLEELRARHLERIANLRTAAVERDETDATGQRIGSVTPRIWTPPLRDLTPETSFGFDLIDFAERIGWPLDPWQKWLAVHLGELLPDGRPRFRMCLVLVARQNGKTIFSRILILYWMLVHRKPLIVGTSTSRETAKASWKDVIDFAFECDETKREFGSRRVAVRETLGEESFVTGGCTAHCRQDHQHTPRSTFQFAAPNRRAGRSKTVHGAVLDELREHDTMDTYNALIKAMAAVEDAQAVAITNQGEAGAIVLDSLRTAALSFIESGEGDPRLFLAEWSAPTGADVTDPDALALANPDLGNRILLDSIIGEAVRAKAAGGEELAGFKTETLCMRVQLLDPAVDPDSWKACGTTRAAALDLSLHRTSVALCLDVSIDTGHATLVAAAKIDGVVHLDVVKAWQGNGATRRLRNDLPDLLAKIRPRVFAWFPMGPAAAVAADLRKRRGFPPRGVKIEEIRADVPAVCMGFADLVTVREVRHGRDKMLNAHVERTQKLIRGDVWSFTRSGTEPVDGTYAAAGAAHVARTMRPALKPLTAA